MPPSKSTKRKTPSKRKPSSKKKAVSRKKTVSKRRSKSSTMPCFNINSGVEIKGARRNKDGECRLPSCSRGHILNPSTGRCIIQTTPLGKALLPYKHEVQARVARKRADKSSDSAQYADEGFAGMYRRYEEIEKQQDAQSSSLLYPQGGGTGIFASIRAKLGF